MSSKASRLLAVAAIGMLGAGVVAGQAAARAIQPACDRACLIALADRYVKAMVDKDPASLPWAEPVRFSEDGVPMMVGDALWGSITASAAPRLRAADPMTGQVAWFGVVEEHGQPAYLALRLRIRDGRIAEAETVLRRTWKPTGVEEPAHDPAFDQVLPAQARLPRARLLALAGGYFDSVQGRDGKVLTAFAADCRRLDNGVDTTAGEPGGAVLGKGCEGQLKLGAFRGVDGVRARSYPIVDVERGVVVAAGVMDSAVRSDTFKTTDGQTHPTATAYPESRIFIQAFRIRDGRIERMESIQTPAPYGMPSPWTP